MSEAIGLLAMAVLGVGLAYLERRAGEKHVDLAERTTALEVRMSNAEKRLDEAGSEKA